MAAFISKTSVDFSTIIFPGGLQPLGNIAVACTCLIWPNPGLGHPLFGPHCQGGLLSSQGLISSVTPFLPQLSWDRVTSCLQLLCHWSTHRTLQLDLTFPWSRPMLFLNFCHLQRFSLFSTWCSPITSCQLYSVHNNLQSTCFFF